MTASTPPISVRLDPALAQALDEYCARTGETRSQVVQEGLAEYLVSRSGPTLSSLAEGVLPPLLDAKPASMPRPPRRKRYRDYVREKRHR